LASGRAGAQGFEFSKTGPFIQMRAICYFRFNGDAPKRRSKELSEIWISFAIRVCGAASHNTDFRLAHAGLPIDIHA
jgi:hypothetical protein